MIKLGSELLFGMTHVKHHPVNQKKLTFSFTLLVDSHCKFVGHT